MSIALHINIDHVATLRQARGTPYPDPVEAALIAERAGADGITAHLREDRRHIQDRDIRVLREVVRGVFNLECAATDEMLQIALSTKPDHVTLVPERRGEQTTEGGLDVVKHFDAIQRITQTLQDAGIVVSLFIDPRAPQVEASARMGVQQIELHTGEYANATSEEQPRNVAELAMSAAHGRKCGLRVAAGHGLTIANVGAVARIAEVEELNIGHAVVSDAVIMGMAGAVKAMRRAMQRARGRRA